MNFFDTKNFSLRREVVKRFLETDPSKQTTSVEKTNYLRFLCRDGDKVPRGTYVEHVSQNHCNCVVYFFVSTHVELQLLTYNYFLVVIVTPTQ